MSDTKPPKILGAEMTTDEHPEPLAEVYTVEFGCLHVALCRYADGRFNPALGAWTAGVDAFDERFVDRADAIAAIERELLAVRAAIPARAREVCSDD